MKFAMNGALTIGTLDGVNVEIRDAVGAETFFLFGHTVYESYIDCQDRVDLAFGEREAWTRKSILTVARMGRFSSDRAIREYCRDIWHVRPAARPTIAP